MVLVRHIYCGLRIGDFGFSTFRNFEDFGFMVISDFGLAAPSSPSARLAISDLSLYSIRNLKSEISNVHLT
jgi:hypothetical protein